MASRNITSRARRHRSSSVMRAKSGLAAGEPIFTGEPRDDQVRISVIDFNAEAVREADRVSPAALAPFARGASVTWINVDGIHQSEVIQQVCEVFGVHPLAMEDVLNPSTRPKVDDYGDHLFIAARMVRPMPRDGRGAESLERLEDCLSEDGVLLEVEAVSLVMGPTWVLSFQENPGDVWEGVRARIREGRGRIRRTGADFLLHALLDGIVDGYFESLEAYDLLVERLESEVLDGPADREGRIPRRAHAVRRRLLTLRRHIFPVHEGVGALLSGKTGRISPVSMPYYRDLFDHLSLAVDSLDSTREELLGVVSLHLSLASHRMNDIMRVLTVVSTIFIPLTFVVGVYGMNFDWMPELRAHWGYPLVMGIMLLSALAMLGWFRRRRWL